MAQLGVEEGRAAVKGGVPFVRACAFGDPYLRTACVTTASILCLPAHRLALRPFRLGSDGPGVAKELRGVA